MATFAHFHLTHRSRAGPCACLNTNERNAGEFAFQIRGVAGGVGRMMQQSMDVIENICPRDAVVITTKTKQVQHL
jgi:hypothetical protein